MVLQNVGFCDRKLPIKNIQKFPFDSTDVTSTKHLGTEGPMVVLDRPIIDILPITRV